MPYELLSQLCWLCYDGNTNFVYDFFWFYSIHSAWAFGGSVHFVSISTSAMPVCCSLLGVSVEFLWNYIDSSALEWSAMQNSISERVLSSEAITMDKWNNYWKSSHDLEINCLFSMLMHFVVLNVYFHISIWGCSVVNDSNERRLRKHTDRARVYVCVCGPAHILYFSCGLSKFGFVYILSLYILGPWEPNKTSFGWKRKKHNARRNCLMSRTVNSGKCLLCTFLISDQSAPIEMSSN